MSELDDMNHLRVQAEKRIAELEAERDKLARILKCSGPSREVCSDCNEISRIGFSVPDDIWNQAVGDNRILCLRCFTQRADFKYVEWDKNITFFPVSKVTHRECADCERLQTKLFNCDASWREAINLLGKAYTPEGKQEIERFLHEIHGVIDVDTRNREFPL